MRKPLILLCTAAALVLASVLVACGGANNSGSAPASEQKSDSSSKSAYPAKFDLRDKGVVTPVKMQNPWSTCWSFAGTAAAETSILTMMKENGQAADSKSFDMSEKHLAWFGTNPITEAVDSSQAGEGMYVTLSEDVPNITWDNGAYGVNVATLFASGVGPVYEKYFPYQGKEGLTEKQYVEKHPEVGKPLARESGETQIGMTLEEAVQQPGNEMVQKLLSNLRKNGYLSMDDSALTAEALEDALYRYYIDRLAENNCYTNLDDWSIPETTTIEGQESLSRNIASGFTLVDGNKLPALFNKDANGKWESINQTGIDAVKSELMRGRGVTVAFKADMAAPGEVSENPMMNEETWAHYSYLDLTTNHEVCIVGWDDDYPASSFLKDHQPPANGAWLVKNSWGSEYDFTELENGGTINYDKWGIVDESGKHTGYFWLSYYDKTAGNCESYCFDTDISEADGRLLVQMYDYMPSTIDAWSDKDTVEQSEGVVKTANVFNNDTQADAKLAAVSTKTASPNATVKYSIYRLKDGFQNPEDGELIGEATATYDYAGFHREKLDGSIVLKPGETFSIVAEETVESNGKTLHEYATNAAYSKAHAEAVKAKEAKEGTSDDNKDRVADEYGVAVVNKGESFIFDGGTWTDWSEYAPRTKALENYSIDNFSIKAYLLCKSA